MVYLPALKNWQERTINFLNVTQNTPRYTLKALVSIGLLEWVDIIALWRLAQTMEFMYGFG